MMSSTTGRSGLRTSKNSNQFSIRSILILTAVVAIAIANPGFALFLPFVVGMLGLVAMLTVIVGTAQFIFADDRHVVWEYTWRNLKWILLSMAFAIAYFAYALGSLGHGLWPN